MRAGLCELGSQGPPVHRGFLPSGFFPCGFLLFMKEGGKREEKREE